MHNSTVDENLRNILFTGCLLLASVSSFSQITECKRLAEWNQLVAGARFMDRFLPIQSNVLFSDTWGAAAVVPRYTDNAIENHVWFYWRGNIRKAENGKYHLIVCGWLESSPRGHLEWFHSIVFNAASDNPTGPFKISNVIRKGHNPEVFQLKDRRYLLNTIDRQYITDNVNGKWDYGKLEFDFRDRKLFDSLSNMSFTRREDGSFVAVARGCEIFIRELGLSEYDQLSDKSIYPEIEGRIEDSDIWKNHIQHHLIVDDWLERIAFYQHSKDGVNWNVDSGEAYTQGITVHQDGYVEDRSKFKRIKIFQDDYRRAIQVNFAVIDTLKNKGKVNDNHSSKKINIPLNLGILMTILKEEPFTSKTRTIRVKVEAEEGFNPITDMDINSLWFGTSTEVNYGRGSKVFGTEFTGDDLVLIFPDKESEIIVSDFAPKLIAKYKTGKRFYEYARSPLENYTEPILSAKAPIFTRQGKDFVCTVEVQNFGQVGSQSSIKIECLQGNKNAIVASGSVPFLKS